MGVHRGGEDVPYNLPIEAGNELGEEMFGDLGYTPKMIDVLELITNSDNHDDNFKRMWLMLADNTAIAPTSSNKVSPRWFGDAAAAPTRDDRGANEPNDTSKLKAPPCELDGDDDILFAVQ
ncbi:hypothetical protein D1007_36397 [Hordeum vulgare]|nr:hypothetical protein D1007_36397 [Hordeum vulgare]